ncbi:hypothetical protein ACYCS5_10540 [Paenibacillus sp. SEL3]|nr:hypothetical protein [Paenibacillus polymyxa]MDY8095773.1 hypothetical protein [Paenibacillus polymyxa]WRL57864.1 hypothetical protein U3G77_06195 [Paenibacillus polymyxa]
MEKLELLDVDEFDMSIQKCDGSRCQYDCAPDSNGNCSAAWTGYL